MTTTERIKIFWKFFVDKMLGPVCILLLTGNLLALVNFIPQLNFLQKRFDAVQTKLDDRLQKFAEYDIEFRDATRKLDPLPAAVDALSKKIGETERSVTADLSSVDTTITGIKAAANITGDETKRLKEAVEFVKDEEKSLDPLARIAAIEKQSAGTIPVVDIGTSWSKPRNVDISDVDLGLASPVHGAARAYLVIISTQGGEESMYSSVWHVQLKYDGSAVVKANKLSEINSDMARQQGYPLTDENPVFEVKRGHLFLVRYPQGSGNVRIIGGR